MFATTLFLAATMSAAQADPPDHHRSMAEKCAKACADCMLVCDMCARHCVEQVAAGKKEHRVTAGFCIDCGDVCGTAGKIMARGGPLSNQICEACAKSCEQCAKECDKFPDDDHMKKCARACKDCAKACRDMLTQASLK